ncbi:putative 3-beta hydroxysteroid dehydrogenase/isomerase [Bimuria novae-zelandiae CBS 107.79]|uniref:Putative 3-beta hydroxysteroid dehydrogenase/isomerase n=1 Tax=Bimuria novae-zelandiae CBS 107.79 TaxID=1447943 RepID=A0A6A5VW97_9PLEO|nr:putative 3-beta hydroxysteroid dehydrogenase/isomerase [Bimuria novae-zelandiae CBS 107.79]
MTSKEEVLLITGPTGFVWFKTLLIALEAGHTVRAVIRRAEQAKKLQTHPKIAPYASKVEFAVLPDLTSAGAFDDKLEGVVAVLHIASPLAAESDDYDRDIIDPAVQICTSMLQSATKAPSVTRVVITSSMVTDRIYTTSDINSDPSRAVSSSMEAYCLSKALARVAARDFMAAHKLHFDVVQLLPGVIIGPDDRAENITDLKNNTPLWDLKLSSVLGHQQPYPMVGVPIHVADVARAHVDAVKASVSGNKDYLLAAGYPDGVAWDSMIDVARRHFPRHCGSKILPLGGTLPTTRWKVDCEDTERTFGWKFCSFDDTMEESIRQYLELLDVKG